MTCMEMEMKAGKWVKCYNGEENERIIILWIGRFMRCARWSVCCRIYWMSVRGENDFYFVQRKIQKCTFSVFWFLDIRVPWKYLCFRDIVSSWVVWCKPTSRIYWRVSRCSNFLLSHCIFAVTMVVYTSVNIISLSS